MEPAVWKRKVNLFIIGLIIVLVLEYHLLPIEGFSNIEGVTIFALSALSLIPLAGFLESAVEELAELLGPFFGGLLHTTASNVAELAISLALLLSVSGGAEVVTTSIAGVIVRNSLLFLGLATFLGCVKNGKMKFSARNAGEYSTIFTLAVIGVGLPTLASFLLGSQTEGSFLGLQLVGHPVPLTVLLAVVLLVIYLAYIAFVVLHVGIQNEEKQAEEAEAGLGEAIESAIPNLFPDQPNTGALFPQERARAEREEHPERFTGTGQASTVAVVPVYARRKLLEERKKRRERNNERRIFEERPVLRGLLAVVVLAASTGLVALMSEAFAGSVEELFKHNDSIFGLSTANLEFFLGLIFIPVLAGLVELYGSVGMARENKMEITIAITAGATIQMILLIVPIVVLVGAFTGHPLSLVFTPIAVIIFGAATFTFMLLSRDGESTVLEGAQLCALWLLIAVIAIFLPPAIAG